MNRRKLGTAGAVLCVLLGVAGCSAPASSSPPQSVSGSAPGRDSATTIRLYTEQPFVGGPTAQLQSVGDQLNAFVQKHPAVFSGAWYTTNYTGVVVGVSRPNDPAATALAALRRKIDPGQTLTSTVTAQYSWAQLNTIVRAVAKKYMPGKDNGVVGVGVNPPQDCVGVQVLRESADDPPLEKNSTVQEITANYGSAVAFSETSSKATTAASS